MPLPADAQAHGKTIALDPKTIALDPASAEGRVEKDGDSEEKGYYGYIPYGVASFAELEMARAAEARTHEVSVLVEQMSALMSNVINDPQIDSQSGLSQLLAEFTQRVANITDERRLKEAEAEEKAAIKRENGIDFPRTDYAFVPDPTLPATWKLRLAETPGVITVTQLGRAAAALATHKTQIPDAALSAVKRRIRSEYRTLKVPENNIPASVKENFAIWKEAASGRYRFMAVYSNNFRDDDNPAEIISAKSHMNFVEMVDEGVVDYPELWHYHIPGTRFGKADMVDFVEGFALASGYVDEGCEKEAEALSALDDIRMSHGMPASTVLRNPDDPTIIEFHVTTEISALPGWAAANKLTDFVVMEAKETEMPLSESKRKHLLELGYTEERITALESSLKHASKSAVAAGIEAKEATQEAAPSAVNATPDVLYIRDPHDPTKFIEVAQMEAPPAAKEETPPPPPASPENPLTREEVAGAIAATLQPLIESIATLQAEFKEIQVGAEAREQEIKESTPSLSLGDLIAQNVIGQKSAKVTANMKISKDGPLETEPVAPPISGIPLLDERMRAARK